MFYSCWHHQSCTYSINLLRSWLFVVSLVSSDKLPCLLPKLQSPFSPCFRSCLVESDPGAGCCFLWLLSLQHCQSKCQKAGGATQIKSVASHFADGCCTNIFEGQKVLLILIIASASILTHKARVSQGGIVYWNSLTCQQLLG